MKKALIIDLEGTITGSGMALPGSIEFIKYIQEKEMPYCIITNTVSKTIEQLSENMKKIGFNISKENIINPITVLNKFLEENNVKSYYFVGPDYLKNTIIGETTEDKPEYIVFCDFEWIESSYVFLNKLFQYIKDGSKIIATSYSNYYLSKSEYKLDTGAFVKMYEQITNEKAIIMGKPSNMIYKMAMNNLSTRPEEIMAIGDDILTDINGGKELGIETTLVKTGKYREGDEKVDRPDNVIENIKEAIKYLE
jgi:HAD superfamily hydrolase (TIGR01458 family)